MPTDRAAAPRLWFSPRLGLTWRGRLPTAAFQAEVAAGGQVAVTISGVMRLVPQASGTLRGQPLAFAPDVAVVHRGERIIVPRTLSMWLDQRCPMYHLRTPDRPHRIVGWHDDLMQRALGAGAGLS